MAKNEIRTINPNDDQVSDDAVETETETVTPLQEAEEVKEPVRYENVRFGDDDQDAVKAVQKALGLEETGVYDASLMTEVARWQNSNGYEGGRGIWLNSDQLQRLLH